jgi:transposase
MITIETWAYIRRRHLHDGVGVTAIAQELNLDPKTVRTAIHTDDFLAKKQQGRASASKLDPFKPAIARLLEQTPHLSGVRLLEKLRKLGYTGGKTILNDYLATLPQRQGEVYLRIETGAGEQAQCDWGKCGTLQIGNAIRQLVCFVMTLSYSRFMFARFYLAETLENFLDGHVRAFRAFGGVPQSIVYDNLKSVVLARHGKTILFNSTFTDFAGYYLFKPEPCRPRAPHLKGKVERGVGFVKQNFLAGREELFVPPADLAFVNHECGKWLTGINQRLHGTTHRPPLEMLAEEQPLLLPLPDHPYDIARPKTIYTDRQAFVHFETNLYSAPPEAKGKPLTLKVTPEEVAIYHQDELLAKHPRSYEKHRVFEKPEHRQAILRHKQQARPHKQREFFVAMDPIAEKFVAGLTRSGARVAYHIARLMQMVDIYGKTEVLSALARACEYEAYHFEYVENIIQQARCQRANQAGDHPGPLHLQHGQDIRLRDVDLSQYQCSREDHDE